MSGTKLASKVAVREGSMIRPIIHRQLSRGDLARLVDEIARMDVSEGREADEALHAGAVDTVLDSPAALEAVLGRGGAPAPLPLTLLWYIPIRAQLRLRGVTDIVLADYAATLPVVFATSHSRTAIAQGEDGMSEWWRYVAALPRGTVAQAEAAADAAGVGMWGGGGVPPMGGRGGGPRGGGPLVKGAGRLPA